MEQEMIIYLVIGVIAGIVIGIIFANTMSPRARKYHKVKQELDSTKQELVAQKQMIVKHFSHSAEILDNMAKDFRKLYQHMAENSNSLLTESDLNNPLYHDIELKSESILTALEDASLDETEPPKDYSGIASGLLKPKDEPPSPKI